MVKCSKCGDKCSSLTVLKIHQRILCPHRPKGGKAAGSAARELKRANLEYRKTLKEFRRFIALASDVDFGDPGGSVSFAKAESTLVKAYRNWAHAYDLYLQIKGERLSNSNPK